MYKSLGHILINTSLHITMQMCVHTHTCTPLHYIVTQINTFVYLVCSHDSIFATSFC